MRDPADQSMLEARWAEAVATGDFTGARGMLPDVRARFPDAHAFELELDAARWLAGRPDARLPTPAQIAQRAPAGATTLARAASFCTRAAVLRFDADAIAAFADVLRALAAASDRPGPAIRAEVARTWSCLARGDRARARAAAAEAARRARETSRRDGADAEPAARATALGDAVVELQAAQALIALGEGDRDGATAAARRAVRMARSESIPPDEFLANIVLARVRRAAGAPHLALRILVALRDLASAPFLPWLDYERILAGGAHGSDAPDTVAGALAELGRALTTGRPDAVHDAAGALRDRTRGLADLHAEASDLLAALGAAGATPASDAMAAWLAATTHQVPRGLHAFASASSDVVAYAVAPPRAPPFRILAPALPTTLFPWGRTPRKQIEPGRRPQERTDAAIALLALRGEAVAEEAFFQELYGFGYRPSLHASVLSTLVHRVRATLGDAAALERVDGVLRFAPRLSVVAWDPRCQRPLEDRILAILTERGPSTAKSAADRLGIPLRTVQAALGELVEGGACKRDRQGRTVEYLVEDTTFSEPTVTRARAWREETLR